MIALTLLLLGFLWGYIGYCAPRYFWLRDYGENAPLGIRGLAVLIGPTAWWIGFLLHGPER